MKRRDLLKFFGAATVASIGGIALIDTHKTFFLPPAGGWREGALRFLECTQYCINSDTMPTRFDAAWMVNGERVQYGIDVPPISALEFIRNPKIMDFHREVAYHKFRDIERERGFSDSIALPLPVGAYEARLFTYGA